MQPVKIHIYSQSHSSAGTENIETQLRETGRKNNKYYVFYDESEAAGLAGTKTTIKWDYERVIILRSGTVDCRQEFAGGLVSEKYVPDSVSGFADAADAAYDPWAS